MKSTTTKRLSVCRQVHTPRRKGVIVRSYTSSGALIEECEVAVRYPEPPPMVDGCVIRPAPKNGCVIRPAPKNDWMFLVLLMLACGAIVVGLVGVFG